MNLWILASVLVSVLGAVVAVLGAFGGTLALVGLGGVFVVLGTNLALWGFRE